MLELEKINYFVKQPPGMLSNDEIQLLVEKYFKDPKDRWYRLDPSDYNKKHWIESHVKDFWKLLRNQIMPFMNITHIYDFSDFIFPPFQITYYKNDFVSGKTFWESIDSTVFEGQVRFDNSIFLGDANFSNLSFREGVSFHDCLFLESCYFDFTKYNEGVSFSNCEFTGNTNMKISQIFGQLDFNACQFNSTLNMGGVRCESGFRISNSYFHDHVYFDRASFIGFVDIFNATFEKQLRFIDVKFDSSLLFSGGNIKDLGIFDNVTFTEKENEKTIFKDIRSKGKRNSWHIKLNFHDCNLSEKVFFERIYMSEIQFYKVDVTDVEFKDCIWGTSPRIKSKKHYRNNTLGLVHFRQKETFYRQLKQNYYQSQDWELSNKAYRSEMYMKQWSILFTFLEYPDFSKSTFRDLFINTFRIIVTTGEFLVFSLHGILSGYAQSILKPIFWLGIFTFLFFPFLYSGHNIVEVWGGIDYIKEAKKSVINSLPFFRVSKSDPGFWIAVVQKILSTLLISFFVLAVRKRFKQ